MAAPTLYLVDTSVWIPLLRRSPADSSLAQRVAGLIAADAVATSGFVRFEVLRGARDEQHLDHLRTMLDGLHQLPTPEDLWDDAASLGVRMRRAGIVTQSSDLLIAAVALRAGATLLHGDRDFDVIAQHAPLNVESHLFSGPLKNAVTLSEAKGPYPRPGTDSTSLRSSK